MMRLGWPRDGRLPVSAHLRWLRRAADLAVPSMTAASQLSLAADQATARLMLGEEDGWERAARIPDDAPGPAERAQVTRARSNIGDVAMLWGRYGVARERLERAITLAGRHQYPRYESVALITRRTWTGSRAPGTGWPSGPSRWRAPRISSRSPGSRRSWSRACLKQPPARPRRRPRT